MPPPLTDEELHAYAHHAAAQSDQPLSALVEELQQRRRNDALRPWAIVVLPAEQAGLVPALLTAGGDGGPVLVIAPDGTRMPAVRTGARAWTLETYDPTSALELRQLLQTYGLG